MKMNAQDFVAQRLLVEQRQFCKTFTLANNALFMTQLAVVLHVLPFATKGTTLSTKQKKFIVVDLPNEHHQ